MEVTPQYTDFRDLVVATRNKYENATALSRGEDGSGCFYGHDKNGLGCAIGCHFPPEVAAQFDAFGFSEIDEPPPIDSKGIGALLRDAVLAEIIRERVSPAITRDQLSELQNMHDNVESVSDFLADLDDWITDHAA